MAALASLAATAAAAQDGVVGPPPVDACRSLAATDACARRRLDFWSVLLRSGAWSPGFDRGDGEVLLTVEGDLTEDYAIQVSAPLGASADGEGQLEVVIISSVGLPWQAAWRSAVPASEARRILALTDAGLATLPPRNPDDWCLHGLEGAIQRLRGTGVVTRAVDFCAADGAAIWPAYREAIRAVQSRAIGCDPQTADEEGSIRALFRCLSLKGDRETARLVRDRTRTRLDVLAGDGDERDFSWDAEVFGGEDFALVEAWWTPWPYPAPEAGRRYFSEVWRLRDGAMGIGADSWRHAARLALTPETRQGHELVA